MCILCCFFHSMRAGSAPCVCLKSAQEVGLRRALFLDGFQGSGSKGQTLGQEQCGVLAIMRKLGQKRRPLCWSCGKEASGLVTGRGMGKDTGTGLSSRISLASGICLTSKVPGHGPVWEEHGCENLDHSHYGKCSCLIVERFYNLRFAICQPSFH